MRLSLFLSKKGANSEVNNPDKMKYKIGVDYLYLNAISENISYPALEIRENLQNISVKGNLIVPRRIIHDRFQIRRCLLTSV